MSLVPFFFVITAIFSKITVINEEVVFTLIKQIFPQNAEAFFSFIQQASSKATVYGFIGFLISFYFSTRIFTALHEAILYVFEEKEVSVKKLALVYIFATPLFMVALIFIYTISLFVAVFYDFIIHSFLWHDIINLFKTLKLDWLLIYMSDFSKILNFITFFIILIFAYYYFPPVEDKSLKKVVYVAFFVALMLILVKEIFTIYITFAAKTNPVYASLSGIFAFLAWLYVSFNLILIGARALYYLYMSTSQEEEAQQ